VNNSKWNTSQLIAFYKKNNMKRKVVTKKIKKRFLSWVLIIIKVGEVALKIAQFFRDF